MVPGLVSGGGPSLENEDLRPSAIFDAPSLYARAWYAARNSEELAGLPSGDAGACAAMKILCSLLGRNGRLPWDPRRLLFCWDGEERKTRKPRTPKPPEYHADQAYFRDLIAYLFQGAAQFIAPGEADDAVATAAFRESRVGADTVVVSGDKDLQQLRRGTIHYYCLNRRGELSSDSICELWHVARPSEVAVALAVIGDPGDGIPGVRNWGPKKFAGLRARFPVAIGMEELVEGMAAQLPDGTQDDFVSSLEVTLLRPDVPGVPLPASYRMVSMEAFDRVEGLRRVRRDWAYLIGREAGS
jgi:DNA polymerase I